MKLKRFLCVALVLVLAMGLCACGKKTEEEPIISKDSNGKTLVVYYSATSHTKKVAEEIAQKLNADTFEIVPKEIYTDEDLDWTNSESRTAKEHTDPSLRDVELVSTEVPNWDSYDTVFIGYPIWFGVAAWPTNSFVKAVDFGNKTVIPFCTSHSAGLGQSAKELQKDTTGGNWKTGKRFEQDVDLSEVDSWIDSISDPNYQEEEVEESGRPTFDGSERPPFDENGMPAFDGTERPPFDENGEFSPKDFKERSKPSGDFKEGEFPKGEREEAWGEISEENLEEVKEEVKEGIDSEA